MKTTGTIRRENLDRLAAEAGSMDTVANQADASPVYLSQIKTQAIDAKTGKPRQMGGRMARKLEEAFSKPTGWMDTDHTDDDPIVSSDVGEPIDLKRTRRLPVVGEVKGGEDGYLEELQYPTGHGEGFVEYPTSDPNAYALRVRGDSMHPRYRAGEFVIVEPNTEPQEGDDVVVILKNGRKMLKELKWRRAGEFQFTSINNGYAPVTLDAKEVEAIQLVGGRARRSSLNFQ